MNKEFIPYEQALALKELGFDEPNYFLKWYDSKGDIREGLGLGEVKAPLYQQAFRWFRENHNLMFQIFYLCNGNYAVIIHRTTPEYMDLVDQIKPSSGCVDEVVDCYSYEEAELACLVKLIEIANKTKYSSNDAPTWYN